MFENVSADECDITYSDALNDCICTGIRVLNCINMRACLNKILVKNRNKNKNKRFLYKLN